MSPGVSISPKPSLYPDLIRMCLFYPYNGQRSPAAAHDRIGGRRVQ